MTPRRLRGSSPLTAAFDYIPRSFRPNIPIALILDGSMVESLCLILLIKQNQKRSHVFRGNP